SYHTILEKNADHWGSKIRIVSISLDRIEDAAKLLEEKKWEKIEHFHCLGGFGSDTASMFILKGIPCTFVIDQKGKIVFKDHSANLDLEKNVNHLLGQSLKEDQL